MPADFAGKRVVITGAGGGIGSSLTAQLVRGNAKVALLGRTPASLELAYSSANPQPGQARTWTCDVGDTTQVRETFRQIIDTFGSIDVLVNNAGVFLLRSLQECTTEDLLAMYRTNVFGVFNCTKEALPCFLKQGVGHMINVASLSGLTGIPLYNGYSDTKAAVIRMSEIWRRELRGQGVRVTTVFNYYTATKMVFPEGGKDSVTIRLPLVPLQRAEEVARAIARSIAKPKKELWVPGYARLLMVPPVLSSEFGDVLDRVLPRGRPSTWRM